MIQVAQKKVLLVMYSCEEPRRIYLRSLSFSLGTTPHALTLVRTVKTQR